MREIRRKYKKKKIKYIETLNEKIENIEDFTKLSSIKPIESIYISDILKKFICNDTFNLFLKNII